MLFHATNKILVILDHVPLMMDVFPCFPASLDISIVIHYYKLGTELRTMSAVLEPSEVSLTKYISAAPIKLDDSKLAALIDKRSEVQVVSSH